MRLILYEAIITIRLLMLVNPLRNHRKKKLHITLTKLVLWFGHFLLDGCVDSLTFKGTVLKSEDKSRRGQKVQLSSLS